MTPLRRILREPVYSGKPVLSGLLEGSRGCPLNTGLTVYPIYEILQIVSESLFVFTEFSCFTKAQWATSTL